MKQQYPGRNQKILNGHKARKWPVEMEQFRTVKKWIVIGQH